MIYENNIQCGYLDNIIYDFLHENLPIDEINNNPLMFSGLRNKEEAKIKLWYNKAKKDGKNSTSHLKLAFVVAETILQYIDNAKYCNKGIGATIQFLKLYGVKH